MQSKESFNLHRYGRSLAADLARNSFLNVGVNKFTSCNYLKNHNPILYCLCYLQNTSLFVLATVHCTWLSVDFFIQSSGEHVFSTMCVCVIWYNKRSWTSGLYVHQKYKFWYYLLQIVSTENPMDLRSGPPQQQLLVTKDKF